MKREFLAGCVVLCLLSGASDDVAAQRRRSQIPVNNAVNPAHEKLKTEADQAYREGGYASVIELTSRVLEENPQDDVALYLRSSARVELGRAQGDVKMIRNGIADSRSAIQFNAGKEVDFYLPYLYGMTTLGGLESNEAHAKTSVTVADQALKRADIKADGRANLLYQRALAKVSLKTFESAAADLREAITLVPVHLAARLALGEAYAAANKPAEARASFEEAIRQFPSNALVYNGRGVFEQQQGNHLDAMVDFTRALEIDPALYVALTNRGYSLMQTGDLESAVNDFSASLKANPNQPMVFNLRSTAQLLRGNLEAASDDLVNSLQIDKGNASTVAELAFVKFFAGEYSAAEADFAQSLKSDAKLRYVLPWRMMCLFALGQKTELESLAAAPRKKPAAERDWIDHLALFAAGDLTDVELATKVYKDDEKIRQAQLCENYFFVGLKKQLTMQPDAALESFGKAHATGQRQLSAYRGAAIALGRLPIVLSVENE